MAACLHNILQLAGSFQGTDVSSQTPVSMKTFKKDADFRRGDAREEKGAEENTDKYWARGRMRGRRRRRRRRRWMIEDILV